MPLKMFLKLLLQKKKKRFVWYGHFSLNEFSWNKGKLNFQNYPYVINHSPYPAWYSQSYLTIFFGTGTVLYLVGDRDIYYTFIADKAPLPYISSFDFEKKFCWY